MPRDAAPVGTCLSPGPKRPSTVVLVAVLGLAATAANAAAPDAGTVAAVARSAPLRAAVTTERMVDHMAALQKIADAHGGNRSGGSDGEAASFDYAAARLREAGYRVRFEDFTLPAFREERPPTLTVAGGTGEIGPGQDVRVRTVPFSGSGTVEAPIWPAWDGVADGGGQGCREGDFAGMPPGAIVLVRRGGCSADDKAARAEAAAAAALMLHDREGGDEDFDDDHLHEPATIPVVMLGHAAGAGLVRAARRDRVTARLTVHARTLHQPTRNLLAETAAGDPDRVVLVGAHMDSVAAGPGINDNASGVAAVLETALQLAKLGISTPNRLRFAFWGAEEDGLLGSEHHAASLRPDELDRIMAVLNFDSLASPNHARFVYDGDGSASEEAGPPGSERIERLFRAYFAAVGLPVAEIDLEDGSDHLSFAERGVPVGGLVAGDDQLKSREQAALFGGTAGAPYDSCYHEACDTLERINRAALDGLADAAAHAVLVLGSETWPRRNRFSYRAN